jgi:hypothetical protein
MRSLLKFLVPIAGGALVAALAACGSGSSNNSTPATLLLINATQSATLTLSLNGTAVQSNVAAGSVSASAASVSPGTYTITVASSTGSPSSSTQTLGLASGQAYTMVAYDRDGVIYPALFTDNQAVPVGGYGTLNVANISPDSGPLDVYVVAPGTTTLAGLAPTIPAGVASAAILVAGTYEVVATASGNGADVRLTLPSVTVANGQIQTLALTSTPGGALVNGVLITQGGGVAFSPATNARVRVVSALPQSGGSAVVATVGSTALTNVFAPNIGAYTLVTGGTSTYSITVAGTPVAGLPAATFTTGGDFTILVYGTTASPLVAVFTDNNQSAAGHSNLRLVNAAVTATGGVTMSVNGVTVATSVGYGAASAYFPVNPSSTASLQLFVPSVAPWSLNNVVLTSSGVYTVFVLDASVTPPLTIPHADR